MVPLHPRWLPNSFSMKSCGCCVLPKLGNFSIRFAALLVEVSRLPCTGFLSPHFLFSIKICSSPACLREEKKTKPLSPNWTAYEAPCCHCFVTCFLWNCYPAGQPVTAHPQCFQIPTKLDPFVYLTVAQPQVLPYCQLWLLSRLPDYNLKPS